jgi:hypothetical protein
LHGNGREKDMNKGLVKIPLYLYCHHKNENEYVIMKVQTLDPEVPSYIAKCPRCGKEVVFDFDGGLANE